MNRQLSSYVEANGLLHAYQSGFRPLYKTKSALLAAIEMLRASLDGGGTAAIILLDLSAAFDTVSHKILLDRLLNIKVLGCAWSWLISYLSNRGFQLLDVVTIPVISISNAVSRRVLH